jgi:RNA polymerase sigma-70 factor, ECF subfamily
MPLEPADFTQLYRRLAPSLLVFFQQRVCDPEVATDLLADTFAIAIESAARFRGEDERQKSGWLWQIAQGVLREHERRDDVERRGRRLAGRERRALSDAEIERIEELAGFARLRDAVSQHLATLPAEQSEAVRMRIVDEMTYQAIADRLGIEVYTARSRVSRGLRTLSGLLGAEHEAWRDEGS